VIRAQWKCGLPGDAPTLPRFPQTEGGRHLSLSSHPTPIISGDLRQRGQQIATGLPSSYDLEMGTELIFEVTEAGEGGFCATALGHGITTQAESLEELRAMVREAVACYFEDPASAPRLIRLHFVRDEILVP
jgi:hypothetical protein